MRVVEKLYPHKPFVLVLTGDGRTEREVLGGLASSFNGEEQLFFPPSYGITGFRALDSLRTYTKPELLRRGRLLMLFLIDKEHFRTDDIARELEENLRERGVDVKGVDKLAESAFCVEASIGQKTLRIYVAVLGHEKCLEENIAELLSRLLGQQIEPSKSSIRRKLRKMGKRLEDVVSESSKELVEEALPALVEALRKLGDELASQWAPSAGFSRRASSTSASLNPS